MIGYASSKLLPGTSWTCAPVSGPDANQSDMTEMLHRMAQDFEDTACDLENGAVDVRHPELLPQLRRDR